MQKNVNNLDCECDDQSPNADQFCAAGEKCKNCKCLPKGDYLHVNLAMSDLTNCVHLHPYSCCPANNDR